ncbi:MAG: hypothetical protein M3384_07610 [Acidobacteriota bacterium]|nr:hypothetical protein [Acidobacteriota bacterium]
MKTKFTLLFVFVCLISANSFGQTRNARAVRPKAVVQPSTQNFNNQNQLPIRRVILYSNGVAYIERRGLVSGNAEINLSFKQSQVDDVLKSMLVLDLGQGKIGAVSYNSSAPVGARMSEIPFSVNPLTADGGGIAGVLAQLQGARVSVTTAKGTFTGAILTVERKEVRTEKSTSISPFLVIASDTGEISSFDLNELRSVKLLDEGTRRDLSEFASASASARRRDAKTISVTSEGAGQREMIVSYTIAAPIWKTTYRVVLDKEGKPFFQGWAIVDNISDEDWQDVQLSLVSGTPISFIQPIQQPFYRYRPVVPIPQDLQVQPQVYEPQSSVIDPAETKVQTGINARQNENLPKGTNFSSTLKMSPAARPEPKSNQFQVDGSSGTENTFLIDGQETRTTISNALTNQKSGVEANTTGGEIGDLFEYRIARPVSVMRDRSALIPIVQTKMDGERVAVYNEAVRLDRPYSGVLLKNMTNLTLENGSMTVIDGDAYAGEALMERLKPKEQRLISFALDLGTHVRVRPVQNREAVKLVKIINGVFQIHYFTANEKLYQITNQTDRPKVLYIEYAIRDGWQLSENTPKPDYSTQRYHRFRVELKPFEEKELTIAERQPLMESYNLTSLTRPQLEIFLSRRYIDAATKAKLEKLIDLRSQIAQIDARLEGFEDEEESISNDQKRLRENIEALSKTPEAKQLITRYIQKADEQESRLEQINKERKTLQQERARIEAELATEIRNFELERNPN